MIRGGGTNGPAPPDRLATWHTALSGVTTGQARILWIGDSIMEGTGSTVKANRTIDKILTQMVSSHPVTGYGRCEYLPHHWAIPEDVNGGTLTPWAPDWTTSTSGTITDENSGASCYGLGMRSGVMATGAIVTYTVTGTDIDIWTNASGTYQYSIDSGAYSATINTSGQNTYADNSQQVHLGTSGSHTVSIKCISGPLNLLGLAVYNGGRSAGIMSYDYNHFGCVTTDFYNVGSPTSQISETFLRNLALVNPHLVVIELGANDSEVVTPSQFSTNYQGMVNAIKTACPTASILAVGVYQELPMDTVLGGGGTYREYVQAAFDSAIALDIPILYLTPPMPVVYTDVNGNYWADGEHMKDAGHALCATVIGPVIDPLY